MQMVRKLSYSTSKHAMRAPTQIMTKLKSLQRLCLSARANGVSFLFSCLIKYYIVLYVILYDVWFVQ